jgi:hypothetical protein
MNISCPSILLTYMHIHANFCFTSHLENQHDFIELC